MSHETRDRIVFAALRLFAEKGYAATSVADILRAADVNAGSALLDGLRPADNWIEGHQLAVIFTRIRRPHGLYRLHA